MTTIDQLIKQSLNPFENSAAANFWEEQERFPTVESIHQEALTKIESVLAQVAQNHQTRILTLYGDAGVGKTHFMGRLKQRLNDQAFFAYIEPFPQSDHIWRHILRYTVDSLVNAPAGQADSQLILWLKSCLSAIGEGLQSDQQSLIDRIKGIFGQAKTDARDDRQFFIDILRKTVGTKGIHNANEFFGVLYDLTNPDLYSLACEWLKGDDLDEDSLKKLRVNKSIDNEDKARGLLGNFSKISAKTQPIVLCFDQLDNIARLPDGSIDLQALFNVNSTIYNGKWQGFLIIISIRASTWNDNYKRVQPADLDRITLKVPLKRITMEQAEALLATRLYHLHHQADPQPASSIYPLTQQVLVKAFPSSKASPRNVLMLGQQLFQDYKEWIVKDKQPPKPTWLDGGNPLSQTFLPPETFQLVWLNEFTKVQQKVTHLRHFSSPELMKMLEEALSALQVKKIKQRFLPSPTYAAYSLSYELDQQGRVGIAWTEDANMTSLCNLLKTCHRLINNPKSSPQTLYLIRAEKVGKAGTVGYRLYTEIFTDSSHHHIKPDLTSLHYLATYHKLVNDACAGELVVGNKTPSLKELEALIRESGVMQKCLLLQDLGIVSSGNKHLKKEEVKLDLQPTKEFLLNLIKSNHFLGRLTLIENTLKKFPQVKESEVYQLIQELCQENKIQIFNPGAKPESQLVCLVPKAS
jgi:hypothetical protein